MPPTVSSIAVAVHEIGGRLGLRNVLPVAREVSPLFCPLESFAGNSGRDAGLP